jgi:hypothetical protein
LKAGCRITGPPRSFAPDALVMRRAMAPKSKEEIFRDLARLADHYGIDLSVPERWWNLLYSVLRDGLVQFPPKRRPPRPRGRPPEWTAEKGLELVNAVEHIRAEKARNEAAKTGKPLKEMGVAAAIRVVQTRFPEKWGGYHADDLRKRYYEAKRVWNLGKRFVEHMRRIDELSGKQLVK